MGIQELASIFLAPEARGAGHSAGLLFTGAALNFC